MSTLYPMSLGLLEGVTQVTMRALVALWASCGLPLPPVCYESALLWTFAATFALVGILTVIWLKIVYTRFETTTGLPIEYGTFHVASVLGGMLFYQEITFMAKWQIVIAFVGLAILIYGVVVSTFTVLPKRANQVFECLARFCCCCCCCCGIVDSPLLDDSDTSDYPQIGFDEGAEQHMSKGARALRGSL